MNPAAAGCSIGALGGLTWLGHSSVVIELDGTRLVTDPVLRRRIWHLRREVGVDPGSLGTLDGILVSHAHFDHLDLASLRSLGRSVPVVVPNGVGELLRRQGFEHVCEVAAGEVLELGGVAIRVTHAEHESRRWPLTGRSAALGYVVAGSRRVYFAGDTDIFDGMAELAPVDVAVLPVSGWGSRLPAGHLDPGRAAEALQLLQPKVAVPVHWGTYRTPFGAPLGDRPAREFAAAAAELAPEVEIRVLGIGETLGFGTVR
ncbi:MAG TPA: MBL fold metallo-hydrolase [Gaiellaceae bacterium]|nr:MBL fold metallo-hydrolase [Gaiellaceae bacterium]